MLTNNRSILLFIVLLSCLHMSAQTRDEFRQRYKVTENGDYLVRNGVVMTISYSKESQTQELRIQNQAFSKAGKSDFESETMSIELASEIVDEIIPVSQRGKFGREINFNAGCSSMQTSQYEKVSIARALTCTSNGNSRVVFIVIEKKL